MSQAMKPIHDARLAAHSNISKAQERNKRSYACRTNHSAAPTADKKATAAEKGKSHVPPVLVHPDGTIQSLAREPYSPPAEPNATDFAPIFTPALAAAPRFIGQPPTLPPAAARPPPTTPTVTPMAVRTSVPTALEAGPSEAGPSNPLADRHAVQPGDFVMVRKHEKVRKSGNKHGKLADKVHGPYILHHFTDSSRQVAILQDAANNIYKQRAADLSVYRGTR